MMMLPLATRFAANLAGLCVCASVASASTIMAWNVPIFESLLWLAFAVIVASRIPRFYLTAEALRINLRNLHMVCTQTGVGGGASFHEYLSSKHEEKGLWG